MRPTRAVKRIVLGLTIFLLSFGPANAVRLIAPKPQGSPQLNAYADSWFDRFTANPSDSQAAWMRANYERMVVFAPYFDSRLSWFPNAWLYESTYGILPNDPIVSAHPEWIMKDANGRRLYIPFACSNGVCARFAGDFSNPEFRRYRINLIKDRVNRGYKGLYMDDSNMKIWAGFSNSDEIPPIDSNTNQEMTQANWRRYMAIFSEQIRAAVPNVEIIHNHIWFSVRDYNDPSLGRQINAVDYINLERGINDRGLVAGNGQWGVERFLGFVDLVHQRGRGVVMHELGTTAVEHEYGLAGYLLVNRGRDLIGSDDNNRSMAPDRYFRGYDVKLGNALGGRYKRDGILRRDFQCGAVLLNQPGLPTQTINLNGTYKNMAGSNVTSVRLGARTGAVLSKPCANNNPSPSPEEPPTPTDPTPAPPDPETMTKSFQNGVGGYAGTRDTTIKEQAPTTNFGQFGTLEADGLPGKMASLIKWNLSGIPKGRQVLSASITFKIFNRTRLTYRLYGLREPWVENQANWRQYASGSNWQKAGANGSADRNTASIGQISQASNGQTYTIRLNATGNALVQSWVNNPSSNNGVAILNYGNWDGVDLYSSETGNKSYRPKLTITYR